MGEGQAGWEGQLPDCRFPAPAPLSLQPSLVPGVAEEGSLCGHSFLISPVCGQLVLNHATGCHRHITSSSVERGPLIHATRGAL